MDRWIVVSRHTWYIVSLLSGNATSSLMSVWWWCRWWWWTGEDFRGDVVSASRRNRNYILDQTNVYASARRRKMKNFSGFFTIGAVIQPDDAEMQRRSYKRTHEDGELFYQYFISLPRFQSSYCVTLVYSSSLSPFSPHCETVLPALLVHPWSLSVRCQCTYSAFILATITFHHVCDSLVFSVSSQTDL